MRSGLFKVARRKIRRKIWIPTTASGPPPPAPAAANTPMYLGVPLRRMGF